MQFDFLRPQRQDAPLCDALRKDRDYIGNRVLTAIGDERAATLLQQGYALLQQDAAALDDETRQRFLTAVPLHRDLVAAYRAWRA